MGFVSTMTWELLSRETSHSAPNASSGASGGPKTTMAYFAGPDGDEMTSVDPNGNAAGNSSEHTSITVMDTFGRTYQTSEPSPDGTTAGPTVTYGYDPDGNETSVTDANGNTTTFTFNNLNEKVAQYLPNPSNGASGSAGGGPKTTWGYNGAGDMTSMTDPLGYSTGNTEANTTFYTYNTWDQMTSQAEPVPESVDGPSDEPVTSYTYDLSGNQTSVTDPDGNQTSYTFNQLNEETAMVGPAVSGSTPATGYKYDLDGNTTETDTPDGNKILDTYDDDDRLTGQLYNNSSGTTAQAIGYGYDADSRMTSAFSNVSSAANQSSTESYGYDDDSRLTGETTTYTGYGVVVALNQTFDADGNRLTLAAKINGTADLLDTFTFNNLDELSTETQQGQSGGNAVAGEGAAFSYDQDGAVTGMQRYADASLSNTSPGYVASNYDADERLSSISVGTPSLSLIIAGYGYDADGRVTVEPTGAGPGREFTYDNDGRETAVTAYGGTFANEAYTYDVAGNRIGATTGLTHVSSITPGTGNRIANDGVNTYTFDSDGNRTGQNNGAGSIVTYTYNAADQLVGASQTTSGSTNFTSAYSFNPVTGQRLVQSSTVGATVTTNLYVYDPTTGNSLLVLSGSGAVTERDLPGQSLNQVLAVNTGMTGSGAGTVYWLLADRVGSVIQVTDNSGTADDVITYDSFGNITGQSNSAYQTRFVFAGMVFDPLTGLYDDNERFYDAPDGTFITQDPTGFCGGDYNLYRYAGGNPATMADPTGLSPYRVGPDGKPIMLQNPPGYQVPYVPPASDFLGGKALASSISGDSDDSDDDDFYSYYFGNDDDDSVSSCPGQTLADEIASFSPQNGGYSETISRRETRDGVSGTVSYVHYYKTGWFSQITEDMYGPDEWSPDANLDDPQAAATAAANGSTGPESPGTAVRLQKIANAATAAKQYGGEAVEAAMVAVPGPEEIVAGLAFNAVVKRFGPRILYKAGKWIFRSPVGEELEGSEAMKAVREFNAAYAAEFAARRHHAWSKYLGGPEVQDLIPLPKCLHDAFHSGLDKILPRSKGVEYYDSLTGTAREEMYRKFGEYVSQFDEKYGTKLLDAAKKEGLPTP